MKNTISHVIVFMFTISVAGCSSDMPFDGHNDQHAQSFQEKNLSERDALNGLEELISGAMISWWNGMHFGHPDNALIVTADALTCSWGNFGMRDLSSEPRAAYDNSPTYRYFRFNQIPWENMYAAILAVNEGLRAISINPDTLGVDTPRAEAFARFVQGLSYGFLALLFDKAFIIDETTEIETQVLEFSPYSAVLDTAIAKLEECISLCNTNTFVLPVTWINGLTVTNDDLAKIIHSYIARYLAQVARHSSERASVDWTKILFHADQGITASFAPEGDGTLDWWHSVQWYHNDLGNVWARADYMLIGPSDISGGYQDWLNTPVDQRNEFEMDTDDLRIWDGTRDGNGNQNLGLYFGFNGPSPYPPDRGTYHYSNYGWHRYSDFRANGGFGPMPVFLTEELDFLRAEALLWTGGSLDDVAALINNTRVNNGGYPPATSLDGAGSVTDARSPLPGASLWAKLKYEKGIECLGTGCGVNFYDRRGWDELTTNTPIHFPVPGKELRFLLMPNYTFGGGGPGSAQ